MVTDKADKDDDEMRERIKDMLEDGMSIREIMRELHIGMGRLQKIMKSIPKTGGDIQQPDPTDQQIINKASQWAAKKSAETLSDSIHRDYIGSIKAAQILREAEMRYRKTLEKMGWGWEEFLGQAIEYAFVKAQELEKLETVIQFMEMIDNE
jgi:transposase